MPHGLAGVGGSLAASQLQLAGVGSQFLSNATSHRQLLQGNAPNATLPNFFNLPVCSSYGSHNSTFLLSVSRSRPGIFVFGDSDDPQRFDPTSSAYMEPLLIIALPGVLAWVLLLITLGCFCYRRYWLGLCGEPFPTVKAYTPQQVCATMCVTLSACVVLLVASILAVTVGNASYDAGKESFLAAGYRLETVFNSSFATGRTLLGSALAVTAELGVWQALVSARVDTAELHANLGCATALVSTLPDGAHMRHAAEALGVATSLFPPSGITDALFAELQRPHDRYPELVPPMVERLRATRAHLAALPSLPLLGERLEQLNATVLNMSGVPMRIATQLVAVNQSLMTMPNLTLLQYRLGRVHEFQVGEREQICANINAQYWGTSCAADGACPGGLFCNFASCDADGCGKCEITECDLLTEQLRQAKGTLDTMDPAAPLALLADLNSMLQAVPPLLQMADALERERAELGALPNLTITVADYHILDETLAQWTPQTIEQSILATQAAATSLLSADAPSLLPDLRNQQASLVPLPCVADLIDTLGHVNATLVRLSAEAEALVIRLGALSLALRALPNATSFIAAVDALTTALSELPLLATYTAGVYVINAAITVMPSAADLTSSLQVFETTLALPPSHGVLVNVTQALSAALGALPETAPFMASLASLVAHKATLPDRIAQALVKIDAYHNYGTGADDQTVADYFDSMVIDVGALIRTVEASPDDTELRSRLELAELELERVPPTMPMGAQLDALAAALGNQNDFDGAGAGALLAGRPDGEGSFVNATGLPNITGYVDGLQALLVALEQTPAAGDLAASWAAVRTKLYDVPSWTSTQPLIDAYAAEEALLPTPPSSLLVGGEELYQLLAAVPGLVASAQAAVNAEQAHTEAQLDLLETALFGEERGGYTGIVEGMTGGIDWGWFFYTYTFAVPLLLSMVATLSCCCRIGRPALHAGQLLLVCLPWYTLLGASVELPTSIMLQDACTQVPDLVGRLIHQLGLEEGADSQWPVVAAPAQAWLTNCEGGDPFSDFYTPLETTATQAQLAATADLAALDLLPDARAQVERVAVEAAGVSAAREAVRQTVQCSTVHAMYQDAKTAVCCDVAYGLTAIWAMRFVCLLAMAAATVGAIAGYKRFRRQRDLWGPYASMQALEVGSYL